MDDPSLQCILKNEVLRVGVKSDVRGLSREVEKGEFSGLEIDLARAIAKRISAARTRCSSMLWKFSIAYLT